MLMERRKGGSAAPAPQETNGILLDLRMRPHASEMPEARRAALRACTAAGFSEDDCASLDLALGEALANAIVHGARRISGAPSSAKDQDVHVSVWDYRNRLFVEVRNSGHSFDPPLPPYDMPSPDADATHGRGLPLMELLTDALLVCRGDADTGGTSTFLIKNLSSEQC